MDQPPQEPTSVPAGTPPQPAGIPPAAPAIAPAPPANPPAASAIPPAPPAFAPAPPGAIAPTQPAAPPAAPPSAWIQPTPAVVRAQGGVTGLSKVGALFLFLVGLVWTLVGIVGVVAAGVFRSLVENMNLEGLEGVSQGQVADIFAGAVIGIALVILVIAIVEMLVGIMAWRGSGFARMLGVLYGLFFGLTGILAAQGATQSDQDTARGGLILLVLAAGYLYTAAVFAVRWRSAR